jgi:hypothetical protein
MEVSGQLHAPVIFPSGETAPGTHYIRGWVDTKSGLDIMEKRKPLALAGIRTPSVQPLAHHYTD